jgi:hypothetical protein
MYPYATGLKSSEQRKIGKNRHRELEPALRYASKPWSASLSRHPPQQSRGCALCRRGWKRCSSRLAPLDGPAPRRESQQHLVLPCRSHRRIELSVAIHVGGARAASARRQRRSRSGNLRFRRVAAATAVLVPIFTFELKLDRRRAPTSKLLPPQTRQVESIRVCRPASSLLLFRRRHRRTSCLGRRRIDDREMG